jgi:hypothetical protein
MLTFSPTENPKPVAPQAVPLKPGVGVVIPANSATSTVSSAPTSSILETPAKSDLPAPSENFMLWLRKALKPVSKAPNVSSKSLETLIFFS